MAAFIRDLDFYNLEEWLSPEEKMTRDAVRRFVLREVLPSVERHFANETFPVELAPMMAELGIFGANLKGYGCAGLNNIAYDLIMQELEAGDSGLRSFASVQSALAMYAIYSSGSEQQKNRYLPEMAKGKLLGCFGLTEPDHGSDPGGMETRARRDGRGWVLNGTKRWITNGSIADLAIVWAKMDQGIAGFIVEKGTPGFTTRDIHGKFSMRASITSELAGYQMVQRKLVDMLTEITKAQLVCFRLGQLKDAGTMRPEHVSFAKRNNVNAALEIARMARDMLGANGIVNEYPVIRHMLNLETVNTYEGTYDVQTLILGRDITGESAFD